MDFKTLLEELKDVPIRTTLYHGTNIENFLSILEDGELIPSVFKMRASEFNFPELATSRKAGITSIENIKDAKARQKKLSDLSENIGKVRFHLYKDRIIASLKGVSTKPIAEIPKIILNKFKVDLEAVGIDADDRKASGITKELLNIYRNVKKNREDFIDNMKTYLGIEHEDTNYNILELFFNISRLDDYLLNREFEERFVFKGTKKSIPLKKELMQIELLPGIRDELYEYLRNMLGVHADNYKGENKHFNKSMEKEKKRLIQDVLTRFKKHSTVFLQNKVFDDTIRYLERQST